MDPLIKGSLMYLMILFTSMLNICESCNPDVPQQISSPLSNMSQGLEKNLSRQRRTLEFPRRSLVFPNGSELETRFKLILPVMGLFGLNNIDISVPLTFTLPSMESARSFNLEAKHRGIFQAVEEFLTGWENWNKNPGYHIFLPRFGVPGKSCILRLICEISESRGLANNGILGKTVETIFL